MRVEARAYVWFSLQESSPRAGHSIGDLGKKYDVYAFPGDGNTYEGPELEAANFSIHDAASMRERDTK